jgi:hypothetical protein
MPDRDKVPSQIPKRYRTVYKQICELQNPGSIARHASRQVTKDVRRYGTGGRRLITYIGNFLNPLGQNTLLRQFPESWIDVHKEIDIAARNIDDDLRFIEWASDACHQVTEQLQYNEEIREVQHELMRQFYLNVWQGRFVERVPLQISHHANADPEVVEHFIEMVSAEMEKEVEIYLRGDTQPETDLLQVDIMGDEL